MVRPEKEVGLDQRKAVPADSKQDHIRMMASPCEGLTDDTDELVVELIQVLP
jgi:hypothetical protein